MPLSIANPDGILRQKPQEHLSKFSNWSKKTQQNLNRLCQFYQKRLLKTYQLLPVAIANNMETWFVKDRYVEKLFESNHEVSKFIQIMCYSGMEDESVTETRVRIYSQLRTKTS